jgi:hypothetical protein
MGNAFLLVAYNLGLESNTFVLSNLGMIFGSRSFEKKVRGHAIDDNKQTLSLIVYISISEVT